MDKKYKKDIDYIILESNETDKTKIELYEKQADKYCKWLEIFQDNKPYKDVD